MVTSSKSTFDPYRMDTPWTAIIARDLPVAEVSRGGTDNYTAIRVLLESAAVETPAIPCAARSFAYGQHPDERGHWQGARQPGQCVRVLITGGTGGLGRAILASSRAKDVVLRAQSRRAAPRDAAAKRGVGAR